jgi:hypothetical protein
LGKIAENCDHNIGPWGRGGRARGEGEGIELKCI